MLGGEKKFEVVLGNRATGKTTELLRWVLEGERCDGYPGWTRVLIVGSPQEDIGLRACGQELAGVEWADLDWSHRVYCWADWINAHGVNMQTEVRVDGIERFWPRIPGYLTGVSLNVEAVAVSTQPETDQ